MSEAEVKRKIKQHQGTKDKPYFPVPKTHPHYKSSGVTIGIGIDLGSRSPQQIEKLFKGKVSANQLQLLKQGAGLKGQAAHNWAKANQDRIKLSSQAIQSTFNQQYKDKHDWLQKKVASPQFDKKFNLKGQGKTVFKNLNTAQLTLLMDSRYLGKNTTQTREKMIPILIKMQDGTATAKDINNLKTTVTGMYKGHPDRQKNMTNLVEKMSGNFNSQDNSKSNTDKNKLNNPSQKLGGVSLFFNLKNTKFDGFQIGQESINIHSSNKLDPSLIDLIVPLKIMYDQTITNKNISISIDPHVPTQPNGPLYQKIYYPPQMEGTNFASIMIEADYLMKQMKIGVDRLNKPFAYPKSLQKVGLTFDNLLKYTTNPQQRTRQWIVIKDVQFKTIAPTRIVIGQIQMGLLAKVQVIGKQGKLIDSDEKPSLNTQKFCQLFTKHYDLIAQQYEVFKQLKQLAKASIIARRMRQQGCRMNFEQIECLFQKQKTDKSSKTISRISRFLQVNHQSTPMLNLQEGSIVNFTITGGCDLNYQIKKFLPTISADQSLKYENFIPFCLQQQIYCQVQDCQNICSNGYKTLKDTRCSEHTLFNCILCSERIRQGDEFIKFNSDSGLAHKNCFKCQNCQKAISGEFSQRDKMFYHKECLPKVTIAYCYICFSGIDQTQKHFTDAKGFLHQSCLSQEKCQICKSSIDPSVLRNIGNKRFHKQCIKCCICSKSILQNEFKICGQGKYAHPKCIPTYECKMCKKTIEGKGIFLGEDAYHENCLICYKCKKPLENQIAMDENGRFNHPDC